MQPSRTRFRRSTTITSARWAAYVAAGAASAFTCAESVEATIHYSGIIGEYSGRHDTKSFFFPLDQPGDSIRLKHYKTIFTSSIIDNFGIRGRSGNGFAGFYCDSSTYFPAVSNLRRGAFISGRTFLPRTFFMFANDLGFLHDCRPIGAGDTGFIGFKFNGGRGDQYGWVRIHVGNYRANFWIIDYAYADPGEPIRAGQTSSNEMLSEESNDMATSEGSLGLLAVGAAGLLAWRKTRSRAAR